MEKRKPRVVALIPLRGGSKSIPKKNVRGIAGRPLAYWVCKAAHDAKNIDAVYVSTDDPMIRKTVESFGLGVNVIDRPANLARDDSSTESVMLHFAQTVPNWDILVTLQATSPLTTGTDIDDAFARFAEGGFDSMLTGVRTKRFFWTRDGKPLNYDYRSRFRRQDFEGSIVENGAFYITKKEILEADKNRLGGSIGIYEMLEDTLVEIDEPSDWDIVEKALLARRG